MHDIMRKVDASYELELDAQFEKAKCDILNSASNWKVSDGAKVYYVSNSEGNDENDGLSPTTPWKTLAHMRNADIREGDAVLLKRGDEWNREGALCWHKGTYVSSYGEGPKPRISNYALACSASDWLSVGKNLWVYNGDYVSNYPDEPKLLGYENDPSVPGSYVTSTNYDHVSNDDIGNIIFIKDGVEGWGVKVTKHNTSDLSLELGKVSNGFGSIIRRQEYFADERDLHSNLEFYHNPKTSRVYLYWDNGNPAEYFDEIRLVIRGYLSGAATPEGSNGTVVDNISFCYCGCHGVSIGHAKNFTMRNCEIGWIGGSIQTYTFGGRDFPTRFGEGFQNWQDCDGLYLYDNYFHDVYDGAASSQSIDRQNGTIMKDFHISGNLFERNTMNVEIWMNNSPEDDERFAFVDIIVEKNMFRNIGYGFGQTRHFLYTDNSYLDIEVLQGAMIFSYGQTCSPRKNCAFRNNVMWRTTSNFILGLFYSMEEGSGVQVYDNTMVRPYGEIFAALPRNPRKIITSWDMNFKYYNVETLETLIREKVIGVNDFLYTEE